uniref:DM2 domain-containing protein n=1 Tax=viral metagenome TaxID=1070528 RepID=A0A6C0KBZ9_9ZZZZ
MDSVKSVTKTNKMPANKKETKTAPVAAETPAAAKAARKAAAAKAEVVVPVVEAAAAPAVAVAVEAGAERSAATILATLQESLRALGAETTVRVRALVAEAVEATKALKRDARNSKRRHKKDPATMTPEERSAWEARRANNAFLKLRPISDELASFMGLSPKSQRSQTDVTKFIATYVKTHSCFDPTFKRRIIPDAKLGKLLRAKDGQEVTYLNLQSFLKVHFLKPTA